MKYDYKKIGERVRAERKKKEWSQNEVLEKLQARTSIGRNSYLALENGNGGRCPIEVFTLLAEIFNCDVGYLLCEYDSRFQLKEDVADLLGLSERAISQLLASDNSRAFVNYFLEYDRHYEVAQTLLNYCYKAAAEKESSGKFRNIQDAHDNAAIMFGERAWAIQKYTDLLNILYDPAKQTGDYKAFLEKFREQKESLNKYREHKIVP